MSLQTEFRMNPKIDFVFKLVFASNNLESNIVLISLLNSILNRDENDQIIGIIRINTFADEKYSEYDESRKSALDIRVKTNKGEIINIEIQMKYVEPLTEKGVSDWSLLYTESAKEEAGDGCEIDDYMLKSCVIINIIDYNLIEESTEYHNVFKLLENKSNSVLTECVQIHYIELNKLKKDLKNVDLSILEEWIIFIRDGGKESNRELVDSIIKNSDVIYMADSILLDISKKSEHVILK